MPAAAARRRRRSTGRRALARRSSTLVTAAVDARDPALPGARSSPSCRRPRWPRVVIAFSVDLISPSGSTRSGGSGLEFRWALVACVGVVLLGTLKGILVAVVLSLLSLLHLANNPRVYVLRRKRGTDVFRPRLDRSSGRRVLPGPAHPADGRPRLLRQRPEHRRPHVAARPRGPPAVLLFDCGGIPGLEYTALKMLDEAEARLRDEGVQLWLAALSPESLERSGARRSGELLGRERMFFTVPRAVPGRPRVRDPVRAHHGADVHRLAQRGRGGPHRGARDAGGGARLQPRLGRHRRVVST